MTENLILLIPGNSVSPCLKRGIFWKEYLVNLGFLIPSPYPFALGVVYVLASVVREAKCVVWEQPLTWHRPL